MESQIGTVRLAELVATLSYAADLGLGQPMEHCMRQAVIALRLADRLELSDGERVATYYLGLMMNVYCHADASEQAKWFGDDISFKGEAYEMLDMSTPQMVAFILRRVGSGGSRIERAKRLASFPVSGYKQVVGFLTTHSTLASQFAERIKLDEAVSVALRQAYEQWDGKGHPNHLEGEAISLPARSRSSAVHGASRRRALLLAGIAEGSSTPRSRTCSVPTRRSCSTESRLPQRGMQ